MNFSDINPHVRYVNVSQYLPEMVVGPRKIYDHQFIYVHKGYGWMNIGEVRYSANPGKLFYYGPGVIHTFIAEKAEPFFLSGVHFDFTKNYAGLEFPIGSFNLEYFNPEACTMTPEFSDIEPIPHYMDAGKNIRIPQIMLDMLGEFESWKGYCQQYLDGQMKTLLALVARQSMLKSCMNSEKHTCHSVISELIEYIRRNYRKNITNAKLAEQYHFHPVYLNRVFKAVTGLTIKQYIINIRIKKAVELLSNSPMTISAVSKTVGFPDVHYFSRIFKAKTGYTPEQIRMR